LTTGRGVLFSNKGEGQRNFQVKKGGGKNNGEFLKEGIEQKRIGARGEGG